MNDSKIKNKIYKINEKSLKKFDEIIMDSIIGLTIYNKADKDMLQRLTLAHISFFAVETFISNGQVSIAGWKKRSWRNWSKS